MLCTIRYMHISTQIIIVFNVSYCLETFVFFFTSHFSWNKIISVINFPKTILFYSNLIVKLYLNKDIVSCFTLVLLCFYLNKLKLNKNCFHCLILKYLCEYHNKYIEKITKHYILYSHRSNLSNCFLHFTK